MTYEDRKKRLNELWITLLASNTITTKRELAERIGVSYSAVTNAFGNDEKSLTPSLMKKIEDLVKELSADKDGVVTKVHQIPLLPIEARGGSLGEYSEGVLPYQCELIQSPIKGAQFAIQVAGDSMSPDYPSGCHVFIKKIDESIFIEWGKVFVLDTANGIVIKQVHPTPDENVIECVSLNPKYAPFYVKKEHIYGWYVVLMTMAIK